MNPLLISGIIAAYFLVLIGISFFTSRQSDTKTFFTANRQSPWYLVAFGMIGASLSGVTFISIPGEVGNSYFSYFQVVLGYVLGYAVIGKILLPLYYKLNLTSIYGYLEQRLGFWSYKTGAFFFLISRLIGSSFRLFLVAGVLQLAVFDAVGLRFEFTVLVTILLIWLYTFRGGIKTIVFTDTLQTFFMLAAVVISIVLISRELGLGLGGLIAEVRNSELSQIFVWDWQSPRHFWKQFLSGAFIAIVMTGLDQDMMQKNLTCRSLGDAQKNMFWFTITLVFVNLLFLTLGAALYLYANAKGIAIPARTDNLYPLLALNHFSLAVGIVFILGIIAAAYSSADSALTALTTSFCVDILNFEKRQLPNEKRTRMLVHIGFSLLTALVVIAFRYINDESVINSVFKAAGYTYGPLLGLFVFGMYTQRNVKDSWVPAVCVPAPILSYIVNANSVAWLGGYKFGFEILLLNGAFTLLGLFLISKRSEGKG
ncbi:sodium:solute symporter [Cytophagales bacterium LB-30]|uniref:Sodium:solute symporter n=1 Tax=Shiella aurantiaca TaxID=3058365 RepID=A0ABT8F825_9BACT|nr:sodium:solute symporter [Shiella aurantiaca]MDN4166389.1 sodium:solute symporter [Shiella aurantiaca]